MLSAHKIIRILFFFIITIVISSSVTAQSDTTGCCDGIRGNINGDALEQIDIGDLIYLVGSMFNLFFTNPIICSEENDINGDGSIDIGDLVHLVSYMFNDGPEPAYCDLTTPLLAGSKIIITMEEVANGTNKELHLNYSTQHMVANACVILETQLIQSSNFIYIAFDTSIVPISCFQVPVYAHASDNLGELVNSTYSLTFNNGFPYAIELKVTNDFYQITGTDERQFIITNPILNRTP